MSGIGSLQWARGQTRIELSRRLVVFLISGADHYHEHSESEEGLIPWRGEGSKKDGLWQDGGVQTAQCCFPA